MLTLINIEVFDFQLSHTDLSKNSQFFTDVWLGHGKDVADKGNFKATAPTISGQPTHTDSLPHSTSAALCPLCDAPVSAAAIQRFSSGKRMDFKMQSSFCRAHKEVSAKAKWRLYGYPDIDWTILGARVGLLRAFIKGIIDGKSSYYRDMLELDIKAGKGRTLLQGLKATGPSTTLPGYYGLRGSRAISETIILEFAPQLREAAIVDRLISARGVAGFVQSVLVPEVAVRLIGEDMGVKDLEARQILKESVEMGNLLNDDVGDIIVPVAEGV
jgi:hypothetical protein